MLFALGRNKDRLQMIEWALEEKAPQTYQELKDSGKLNQFLEDQEAAMMESFMETCGEAWIQIQQKPQTNYDQRVKELHTIRNEIWHQTMDTWLDFSDP